MNVDRDFAEENSVDDEDEPGDDLIDEFDDMKTILRRIDYLKSRAHGVHFFPVKLWRHFIPLN